METETQKQYEISFLAKDETGVKDVLGVLRQFNAEITSEGSVSRITLAYPIERHTQADFCFVQFAIDPARVADIDRSLKGVSSLLRFLIVTPPFAKNAFHVSSQQSMIRQKPSSSRTQEPKVVSPVEMLTNEALEKKIEEILK